MPISQLINFTQTFPLMPILPHQCRIYLNLLICHIVLAMMLVCTEIDLSNNADTKYNRIMQLSKQFDSCCTIGRSAAEDLVFIASNDSNTKFHSCAIIESINQTDLDTTNNNTNEFNASWCQNVQQLCCLLVQRKKACQLGSEHIIKHQSKSCLISELLTKIDSELVSTAKECCLCQLIQTKQRVNLEDWIYMRYMSEKCTYSGQGCCDHLNESILRSNQSDQIIKKINQLMSDDPNMQIEVGQLNQTTNESISQLLTANQEINCQDYFVWDSVQEMCVRTITTCPIGMYLDKKLKKCTQFSPNQTICEDGYRYSSSLHDCEDVDECKEAIKLKNVLCTQQGMECQNLPGTYNCTCSKGFAFTEDGNCTDINECITLHDPCKYGQQCRNLVGSYQCVREVPCGYGYVLNPITQHCEDVNECKIDLNICGKGMSCINIRGGHKCVDDHCPGRARRNKAGDCVPCPTGYIYNITSEECEDADECNQTDKCRPWENCVNKPGYYVCEAKINCDYGTRINDNGTECADIDECVEKMFNCDETQICVNKNGSYLCIDSPCTKTQVYDYRENECKCEDGYESDTENECVDINECAQDKHNCTQKETCVNEVGSFRCIKIDKCLPGFKRNQPLARCEDIDECALGVANCSANMNCNNIIGSYQCLCKHGYKSLNETTCIDVDECTVFRPDESCPDPRAKCVNTNGGYTCLCPDGFVWTTYPESKCKDINECENNPTACGALHQCVNLEGAYRCECAVGYKNGLNDHICVDIDECNTHLYDKSYRNPCPHSFCINTRGGYTCQCPDGFRLGRGRKCYDINECRELVNACKSMNPLAPQQACINLMGSYRCIVNQCPTQYIKSNIGNGFRCEMQANLTCSTGTCAQRIDELFIELDQNTTVPQVLARVDTKRLPAGVIRVDLREQYAYDSDRGRALSVTAAFRLEMSRTQPGTVEVLLLRKLPAPMNILIIVHLTVTKNELTVGHLITKLYLFVTQTAQERLKALSSHRVHKQAYPYSENLI